MNRLMFGALLAGIFVGCKARPLGPYISPRVTGQVRAADTREPLAGVRVTRGASETARLSALKGGELLMRKPPARTDANGRFDLASERVLSVVRGAGWNMVSLSFDRLGYQHFHTNWPMTSVTNAAGGEPWLDVGAILLKPALK